ncbi:MAG TPA: hypothetical protein VK386_04780 [Acidimicrobiales bacterium]|nr:hypothetical protein [Acidimicrobiales bacterium]
MAVSDPHQAPTDAHGDGDNGVATHEAGNHGEDDVDEASEESFPASDSPASWSGPPDN